MAVKEGDTIVVEVTQIEHYGIRIEDKGERGLVNITDMTWGRIHHPSDMVSVGDVVEVKVVHLNPNGGFRASLKHAHPELNPWNRESSVAVGDTFVGPIADIRPYGCFVEITPILQGLILRSAWWSEYTVGQIISVKVISVDAVSQKVALIPEISETGHHVHEVNEGI